MVMPIYARKGLTNQSLGKSLLSGIQLLVFLLTILGPLPTVMADKLDLPKPGTMVNLSPAFNPPVIKGIKFHPENPFRFDFLIDKGDKHLANEQLKLESTRLIKYFLASLTIPEKDLWVNLSPYEKDRIVPDVFGLTEMGRDLLAQDYMLKQITASLIYPEDKFGKKFWQRIYKEAARQYHTSNIPVNTFNKVWIVPEKAMVYENIKMGTAYVVESELKVMLDQDYLAWQRNNQKDVLASLTLDKNELGSRIVRELVIPQLTREINEGSNFAQLRQVYHSLILATWYKMKIKDSILAQIFVDKEKVAGVNVDDPQEKLKIYQQYLMAFKKGVYNFVKDESDPLTKQMISRRYFSGGINWNMAMITVTKDTAKLPQEETKQVVMVQADINPIQSKMGINDDAKKSSENDAGMVSLSQNEIRVLASLRLNPLPLNGDILFEKQFFDAYEKLDNNSSIEDMINRKEQLLRNPLLSSEIFRLQIQNLANQGIHQSDDHIKKLSLKVLKKLFLELSIRGRRDVLFSRNEINLDFLKGFPDIYDYFENALNNIGISHVMEFNDVDLDLNALLPHMRSTVLLRKRLRETFWEEFKRLPISTLDQADEQIRARKALNQMLHREDLFTKLDEEFIQILPQSAIELISKLRKGEKVDPELVINLNRSIVLIVFSQDTRRFSIGYRLKVIVESLVEFALNDSHFRNEILDFLNQIALTKGESLINDDQRRDFVSADLLRQESFYGLLLVALKNSDLAKSIISMFIEHIDDNDRDISSMSLNMLLQYISQTDEVFRDPDVINLLMKKFQQTLNKSKIMTVFEYLALNHVSLFTDGKIKLIEIKSLAESNLSILSDLCYFLSQRGLIDPVITQVEMISHPIHQNVRSILGIKNAQVLIVHNINEPMGDELARNAFLLRGLLAFNSDLEITVVTNKPFLYSNPRIHTLDSKAAIRMDLYQMVVYQHIEGREIDTQWDRPIAGIRQTVPIFMEVNGAIFSTITDRKFDLMSTAYDHVRVGDETLKIDNSRLNNVYDYGLRLFSRLGLPLTNLKESILVNAANQMTDSWWDKYVTNNIHISRRKIVIFNPFGGGFEQKGYMVKEMLSVARDITRLIQTGYGIVLVPGRANWIDDQALGRTLNYIHPDLRKYIVEAPSLVEYPGAMKYLIKRSDKIVAVEGGLIHLAIALGKKDIMVLIKEGSGNAGAYLPYYREPGQKISVATGISETDSVFSQELLSHFYGQISQEELEYFYIPLATKLLEIRAKKGNSVFAVGGRSGVGKTNFVKRLGLVLEFLQGQGSVAYIHQDKMFLDGKTGVSPKNLNIRLILTAIENFKKQTKHKILLIEGSYVLIGEEYKEFFDTDDGQAKLFKELDKKFDTKILLDADSNLIRDWRFSRSEDRKGRTEVEIKKVWTEFEFQRQSLVSHDRRVADVIVTKTLNHQLLHVKWKSNDTKIIVTPLDIKVEWISQPKHEFKTESLIINEHILHVLLNGLDKSIANEIQIERNDINELVIAVLGSRGENVLTLKFKSDQESLWPRAVKMYMSSDNLIQDENFKDKLMQRVLDFLHQRGFKHLLLEDIINPDDMVFLKNYPGVLAYRQQSEVVGVVLSINKAMRSEVKSDSRGGIDFNSNKLKLLIQNNRAKIKWDLDPAMLSLLENTTGFIPNITKIQPVEINVFLGLN